MPNAMNLAAFGRIPEVWTWFYIVPQDIWIMVLLYLVAVIKYSDLKLGRDEEEPEYTLATWLSMLFSAGVATDLVYHSAAGPGPLRRGLRRA